MGSGIVELIARSGRGVDALCPWAVDPDWPDRPGHVPGGSDASARSLAPGRRRRWRRCWHHQD